MTALSELVGSRAFKLTVISLILANAAVIGLETYPALRASHGELLHRLDRLFLGLFTLEIALRYLASQSKAKFFRDPWQWFDAAVIGGGYLPATGFLTILRLLRCLRILRTVVYMPSLQRLASAFMTSLPSLGNITLVLGLIFYIYGTAGTILLGDAMPGYFGTLDESLLTLFQIITLAGWEDLMRLAMRAHPWAWLYFVSFILVGTFFSLNAFIGILVTNLQFLDEEDELARVEKALARIEEKLDRLSDGRGA